MNERAPDVRARAEVMFGVWNEQGMEAMAERFWHPDIVWEEPARFPEAGVHHGRAACVRRMSERFVEVGEVKIEVVDARLVGDQVLTEAIIRGQGAASGVPSQRLRSSSKRGRKSSFRSPRSRSARRARG